MKYRPEIDGLRAVAVTAVILFHLDDSWLVGGFLGVDVFFTVSGYLISMIILRDCSENRFNIWHFWKRRAKRLVPALATVVACTMIAGNFLFIRPERTDLPLQAISSLFSFANIFFWRTTGGYWTAPADSMPLLHTWSLSLEEQFYLFFPPLILLLRRFALRQQFSVVTTILVGSFMLCVVATPSFRSASFFLLPTRMWELLLGACLACIHLVRPDGPRWSTALRWLPGLGLGLIGFSLWLIPNDDAFPGWKPLVPCLGTLMILNASACQASISLSILKHPCLVFVGKLSYSLYLWHWPVFVFLPYTGITSPLAKLSWTLSLAVSSYFLIEKPLRYGWRGAYVGWVAIPLLVVAGFGALLSFQTSPLLSHLGNLDEERSVSRGHEYEATSAIRDRADAVFFGDRSLRPQVALIGSSHARILGAPIEHYTKNHGFGLVSLATTNLGLTSLPHDAIPDAETLNAARIKRIQELEPDVIFVAGMWSAESKRTDFPVVLASILKDFYHTGAHVAVMGQVPMVTLPDGFDDDLRKYLIAKAFAVQTTEVRPAPEVDRANRLVREVVKKIDRDRVVFLDPTPSLMVGDHIKLSDRGLFLYSDYHHINDDGAKIVFEDILRQFLEDALADN